MALVACGSSNGEMEPTDDSQENVDLSAEASPQLISELSALTAHCNSPSHGKYATDDGEPSNVSICKLNGAYFWKADMDVDCDGQSTSQCNHKTDPWYQNQTSFNQSNGKPLVASSLPYVVIPLPSSRFSYHTAGIHPGAVVAVIYNGKLSFGVFGDEGPSNIIGESSYAMAKSLGINPDPENGGTDGTVTYIAFTGGGAVASPIENHQAAVTLGQKLASALIQGN
jgi:hypothetical protein